MKTLRLVIPSRLIRWKTSTSNDLYPAVFPGLAPTSLCNNIAKQSIINGGFEAPYLRGLMGTHLQNN
jgi:hypothetical protein